MVLPKKYEFLIESATTSSPNLFYSQLSYSLVTILYVSHLCQPLHLSPLNPQLLLHSCTNHVITSHVLTHNPGHDIPFPLKTKLVLKIQVGKLLL